MSFAPVDVNSDAAFGYPTSITLDSSVNVAEGEISYTVTNFHVR